MALVTETKRDPRQNGDRKGNLFPPPPVAVCLGLDETDDADSSGKALAELSPEWQAIGRHHVRDDRQVNMLLSTSPGRHWSDSTATKHWAWRVALPVCQSHARLVQTSALIGIRQWTRPRLVERSTFFVTEDMMTTVNDRESRPKPAGRPRVSREQSGRRTAGMATSCGIWQTHRLRTPRVSRSPSIQATSRTTSE